jgi:hypothetical protein
MKEEDKVSKLGVFLERMQKIGINIQLMGNYPWIYIYMINGKRVKEQFLAEHGFTIMFQDGKYQFTDIKEIFKLIKKYK